MGASVGGGRGGWVGWGGGVQSPQTGPDARRLFVLKPGVSGPGHCFTLVKITSFIYFAHLRRLRNNATTISVLSGPDWPDLKALLAEFLAQVCGPATTHPPDPRPSLENGGVSDQSDASGQGVAENEARKVKFK